MDESYNIQDKKIGTLTQPDDNISFVFEQQDNRLIINAQTNQILYSTIFQTHPLITFQSLIKTIQSNHLLKIVQRNKEVLKINVAGLFNLDFRSKDKIAIDQLKYSIQNITIQLQAERNKNNQLSQITTNQQTQIQHLTAQLTQLRTKFDELITQTIPKCINNKTQLFKQSEIILKPYEEMNLKKFFQNKDIKNAKLLYRASENYFCVKKFHEICDGILNTLTIIWTGFNMKIGGFTPLKWSSSGGYTPGNLHETFIFSITHNDKFNSNSPAYAIYNDQSIGPKMGGGNDFRICDKANSQAKSGGGIGNCFKNQNYTYSDKASLQKFHGDPAGTENFKIKEWEVWKLELA